MNVPENLSPLPATVNFEFVQGGHLVLGEGQKLEIRGDVRAPAEQQIFKIKNSSEVFGFQSELVSPKWWGALADGITNDTAAFQKAARELQNRGGGRFYIPAGEYIVGGQSRDPSAKQPFKLVSNEILAFKGLSKKLVIEGASVKGTKLKLAPNLKYGSFDPKTGFGFFPATGRFTDRNYSADVGVMIQALECSDVTVRNLELDGNLGALELGGQWGDVGRQNVACGLRLYNNKKVLISEVYTHHHGLDGLLIGFTGLKVGERSYPHVIEKVISEYNGRQGLSIVGGNSVTVRNSKFSHSGRGKIRSPPGAGIDIEAERAVNRNILMEGIEVIDNLGVGIVADSGDSADITIRKSRVVGTTNFALWLRKPRVRVESSHISGSVVNLYTKGTDAFQAKDTVFDDLDFVTADGKKYPSYTSSAVIELNRNGGEAVFDGVTIIGSKTRPLWMDKGTLRNATVVLKKADLPSGDFAAIVRSTSMENVIFKFQPEANKAPNLKAPWYISPGPCQDPKVSRKNVRIEATIQGKPYLSWCSSKSGITTEVFP